MRRSITIIEAAGAALLSVFVDHRIREMLHVADPDLASILTGLVGAILLVIGSRQAEVPRA